MAASISRRRFLHTLAVLSLPGVPARRAAAADNSPIEVGVMPYMPTAALLSGHQGLCRFLEQAFGRPVALSTAPDFRGFHRRTLAGEFDLVITGPPLGWDAHLAGSHQIIAVSRHKVRVLILVARDAAIRSVADLRGKTIATIDPMTLTAQTTATILREHQLTERDVGMRYEKTPFNCAQGVALGEVDAAGFPNVSFPNLPAEVRDRLRVVFESPAQPGILFLARRSTESPQPEELQKALFRFVRNSSAGRQFLAEFNHIELDEPDMKVLQTLDRFIPELKRLMAGS